VLACAQVLMELVLVLVLVLGPWWVLPGPPFSGCCTCHPPAHNKTHAVVHIHTQQLHTIQRAVPTGERRPCDAPPTNAQLLAACPET
jgi:hypothetical protein